AISGSGRELEPIFQEMLTNAMSICDAKFGILYEFANGQFRAISWKGVPRRYAEYVSQWRTWGPANGLGQTMLTKQTVHIPDVVKGPAYATARTYGLEVITLEIRRGEDIAPAFEALKGRAEALYVIVDPLVATHRIRINTLVLAARLPTMHSLREGVEAGGLMSYGANFPDLLRRAADFVDKVLRGAKPADIPVEQPTKFDLIINITTAKALGLEVPPTLLARADEVIE